MPQLADSDRHPDETHDYLFTSPPYMNALRKSRGGNKDTRHKKRMSISQPTIYGNNPLDIGNIEDPACTSHGSCRHSQRLRTLKRGAYCTIVIQNLNFNGSLQPIA